MKTTPSTAAAPATAGAAPAAPAPAPSGNLSLSALASSFKRPVRSSTPAAAPASPPAAAPAEEPVLETEHPDPETQAAEPAPEEETPVDASEEAPADEAPTEEPGPEGNPELSAAETDAMTDAEFAEYVTGLTESKAQKKMLQRIHRLTWRLKQAEKAPPENPEAPAAAPNHSGHQVIQQINADLQGVNEALAWVDENPEGGEFTDRSGKARTYTAAQVRAIRRNAEQARSELLTERSSTLTQLRAADATVRTKAEADFARTYANMGKAGTPEHEEFATIARQAPELQRFPDWKLWVAWSIEGRKAWEARQKAAPKGAPKTMVKPPGSKEPPAVTTRPAAGAPRVNGRQKAVTDAENQFGQSGKLQDLALMFSKRKQMRTQPA